MGSDKRETTSSLSNQYLENFCSYNFFQLVVSISKDSGNELDDIGSIGLNESLFRFTTDPTLAFPTRDIAKVEHNRQHYIIYGAFLGLQGTVSPLPGAYIDQISYEYSHNLGIKHNYLDFFNHRLISLLFRSWKKHKYHITYKARAEDKFSEKMFSLMGLKNARDEIRRNDVGSVVDWVRLLPFIGVLASGIRSPNIISKIISAYFSLNKVHILEWQRRIIEISHSQKNSLGDKNMTLGDTFILGSSVISYSEKFIIVLDSLSKDQFYSFLPHGEEHKVLKKLLLFLLNHQLPYDIQLGLDTQSVPEFVLGQQDIYLGWTSLLLNKNNHQDSEISISIKGEK